MELFQASNQWAVRPADERFTSVEDLYKATKAYADTAVEAHVAYNSLRVQADGKDVVLVGKENAPARFTNHAFKQICARTGTPAAYLTTLPPTLAAQNLNYKLANIDGLGGCNTGEDEREANVLLHKNGSFLVRAFTSDKYFRYWNWEAAKQLLTLQNSGWKVPPARPAFPDQPGTRLATEADVLRSNGEFGLSIKVGDPIAPAGLYASDHDMFAFMVNDNYQIDSGGGRYLLRGFFLKNSEVGDAELSMTKFNADNVCGNHIVWGAKDVSKIGIRHVGKSVVEKAEKLQATLIRYANESASDEEAKIQKARSFVFGKDRDEVIDTLFNNRHLGISKKNLQAAYDSTDNEHPEDGNPRSAWGIMSGLTRVSQKSPYADVRNDLDVAAGRVLEVVPF